jgi:pyridoxine 4-dehydrogenase
MRKPPSGYSTDVAIPLPTDEQLGAETVAKLKLANDPQVREGQDIRKIACVENQYNLVHRGDDPLIAALAKNGTAYVPFFSLGGLSPPQSSALSNVAATLAATPMQVALAWLLQRSPNILLIPGTPSIQHLRENLKAADLALDADSIRRLDAISPQPIAA